MLTQRTTLNGNYLKAFIIALVFFAAPHAAHAAIAFDATSTSNVSSWSHTTSGTNRDLVCFVVMSSNTVPTVTYNSVSMTQFDTARQVGSPQYQFGFNLVGPTSGTNTVSVTGGGTFKQAACSSYTGVNQTGQPDATAGADTGGGTATSITSSITTINANAVIVAGFTNNGALWGTLTNMTNTRVNNLSVTAQTSVTDTLQVSPGALSQSAATQGATSAIMGISQISLIPAAAAASTFNFWQFFDF